MLWLLPISGFLPLPWCYGKPIKWMDTIYCNWTTTKPLLLSTTRAQHRHCQRLYAMAFITTYHIVVLDMHFVAIEPTFRNRMYSQFVEARGHKFSSLRESNTDQRTQAYEIEDGVTVFLGKEQPYLNVKSTTQNINSFIFLTANINFMECNSDNIGSIALHRPALRIASYLHRSCQISMSCWKSRHVIELVPVS